MLDGDKSPAESADKSAHSKDCERQTLRDSCLFVSIRGQVFFLRTNRAIP